MLGVGWGHGREAQERKDVCILTANSRYFTAETNTTIQCNYTPIKKKILAPTPTCQLCNLGQVTTSPNLHLWHPTPVLLPGKSHGQREAAVHGVAEGQTRLSDFTFTFHFHALEKEMATHSSVLAWRIPGTGEPAGLPFMGSHRVRHD